MKILHLLLLTPFFALTTLLADNSAPTGAQTQAAPESLAPPVVHADPAAVEAALTAMHFNAMIDKLLEPQKRAVAGKVRQMLGMMKLSVTSPDELAAYEKKTMDTAWAEMKPEIIHADIARIYGEVFTTEELQAMANFYNTPAGQAISAKQSDIQQRLGIVLKAHMSQMAMKAQQMIVKFSLAQKDKAKNGAVNAQAQKAAGGSTAPATSSTPVAPATTASPKP